MTELAFELQDVCFSYADQSALREVSLEVRRGERIALLGANGSGKSTLLRMLDALCFAQSGVVRAFGGTVSEHNMAVEEINHAFRRRVGFVFQNADVQLFNATVFDEVAFGPLQLRWSRDKIILAVESALRRMKITHLKSRSPHRLSGGEKKRVALASVLVMAPDVFLLDEPTAALDPESQSDVVDFLADHTEEKTTITATHDLSIVRDIADRVIVLQRGQIVYDGEPVGLLGDVEALRRYQLMFSRRTSA